MKTKKRPHVRSEINFVRTYPFYLKLGVNQAFSFLVTVSAQKKINPTTGMSVDLVSLDQLSAKVLKAKRTPAGDIVVTLRKITAAFKAGLGAKKTKLVAVRFDECRGSGYLFKGRETYFIRQDFAMDDTHDLFKVVSYFNQKNALVRLDLKNLKSSIEEQIIF